MDSIPTLKPVRDCEGNVRWRVRVAASELTCTGCGETAVNGLCIRCGTDDHGVERTDAPPLVPTLSYLKEGEYELCR